jgi:hypothetical protein
LGLDTLRYRGTHVTGPPAAHAEHIRISCRNEGRAVTMAELTLETILVRASEMVIPENLDDTRIDPAAQDSLSRLSQGSEAERVGAFTLLAGVKSEVGGLNGIVADDSDEAAELAAELQVAVEDLASGGGGATIVTPPDAAPTVVFQAALKDDPGVLDSALMSSITIGQGALASAAQLGEVGDPTRPWLCSWICGLCALALLDGVPFDEIPVCAACLTCVAGQG